MTVAKTLPTINTLTSINMSKDESGKSVFVAHYDYSAEVDTTVAHKVYTDSGNVSRTLKGLQTSKVMRRFQHNVTLTVEQVKSLISRASESGMKVWRQDNDDSTAVLWFVAA